jgi:hypothetical protein
MQMFGLIDSFAPLTMIVQGRKYLCIVMAFAGAA